MDAEKFVQNIKMICLQKGVKPTIACKESGVGGSFINDIERGRTPSVAKVQMLADYLGVTTSELLGEELPAQAAEEAQIKAAFWGDDKDLTPEAKEEMWQKLRQYAETLALAEKQKNKKKDG